MAEAEVCPYCKSDKVARISYGRPAFSAELRRELEEGKVVLKGTCYAEPENRTCLNCQKSWRSEQQASPREGA